MSKSSAFRGKAIIRAVAIDIASIAGLVLIWHAFTASGLVSRIYMPTPAAAFDALWYGLTRGQFLRETLATVMLMLNGWLLASLVGIVLGSLIGIWAPARQTLGPLLEFLRPLPASAIIPVAIALFGLTPQMVLGVVIFGSVWPTLLATIHGFSSVEPRLKEVSGALNLSPLAFVLKIGLPNAVPDILAGMRLSLTVSLIIAVVAEMLAGETGLGTAILLAGRAFSTPDLFAGLLLLAAIGLVSDTVLGWVERYLLRWRG